MTSFQPSYLAEEIVLLLEHLYLGLLPGDQLVLGQLSGPWPAAPLLVGELYPGVRFGDPVARGLLYPFLPDDFHGQPVRLEDLVPGLSFRMQGDELLHEFFGEGNAPRRRGFHPRI